MTEITPYDYQFKAITETQQHFANNDKHVLIQIPTGGGKTIVFCYVAQQVVKKFKKVLIITDRDELLKQAGGTLSKFGLHPQLLKASAKFIDHRKDCFVGMSQTLRNRLKLDEWKEWLANDIDLVIIDECHGQEFNHLFDTELLKDKFVIGVTATPERRGKMRQLGLDYDRMVRGPSVKELVRRGYLVNCDHYEAATPDMKGVTVNSATGDFSGDSMYKKFNSPTTYRGLINQYKKHTPGQKMIVFCCNVEHAIKTCQELHDEGYKVKFLASEKGKPKELGENPTSGEIERYKERLRVYEFYKSNYEKFSDTRKRIIDGFANDEFTILVNVDILTKGYDCPSIQVVALCRATLSLPLYLQMIGRGSRTFKGKHSFTVLDFGGNKSRLGDYDSLREWSLWHETKKGGSGTPPLKECGITNKGKEIKGSGTVQKGCKRLIMATMNLCPFCGFKYPEKKEAEEVELTLASIVDENGISLAVKPINKMSFEDLKKYREVKSHKVAWLWRQLWIRGGEKELQGYAKYDRWSNSSYQRALSFCKNRLG